MFHWRFLSAALELFLRVARRHERERVDVPATILINGK